MAKNKSVTFSLAVAVLCFWICGCASYQEWIGRENWVEKMASSAIVDGSISYRTQQFLVENALSDDFSDDPEAVIRRLAEYVDKPGESELSIVTDYNDVRPVLNALIELCMYQAENSSSRDATRYWVACSFYSYRLLFDRSLNPNTYTFDHLSDVAALRYYNISTSNIFTYFRAKGIPFEKGAELPSILGTVRIEGANSDLLWPPDSFKNFTVAYDYLPTCLNSHSFTSGMGVPLVGLHNPDIKPEDNRELVFLEHTYPITFLIRYNSFSAGPAPVPSKPEFYDCYKTEATDVCGIRVPLAKDYSIALTTLMSEKQYMRTGILGMIHSDEISNFQGLYMISPYDKDKIPVVLVHGLMSAPRTWAQVLNTLLCSPEIRDRYQFWLFAYPTGQPVYFSAAKLRSDLLKLQKKYDPSGSNPNFNRMVIVGHSLGGLLTRLMISGSDGDKLADNLLGMNSIEKKFSDLEKELPKKDSDFLSGVFLFDSLPFVRRVVFIAAPHRGSGIATWQISRLGSWLIYLPVSVANRAQRAFQKISMYCGSDKNKLQISTSIDNLEPDSIFMRSYNSLDMNPSVIKHSIIGNLYGDKDLQESSDGVVPYTSSHIGGVESELVVISGHNVQDKPECSREIRRILAEHLNCK